MSFDAFDCVLITVTCLDSSKTSRGEIEKEKSCLIVCPLQLNHRNNRWAQNRLDKLDLKQMFANPFQAGLVLGL